MQHTKGRLGEVLKKKWKKKVMHGQYIRNMDRQLISEEEAFLWLSRGDLKAETESEIVAAQDQALNTKYYATKILHTETESKCRLCQQHDETIDHIMSACPILAKEDYVMDERTGLQCEGGNARCISWSHFGCRRPHRKQPAEAATSNSRSSQKSGSLCCGPRWNFRKPPLSTDLFKLKVIS